MRDGQDEELVGSEEQGVGKALHEDATDRAFYQELREGARLALANAASTQATISSPRPAR